MAERLPPQTRDSLSGPEQDGFDSITSLASTLFGDPKSSPFVYARPSDGALVGPMPFFLASPQAGEHVMGLFGKLGQIPGLPAEAKEVAILTVGAHHQAAYELYAHTRVATKKAGMDEVVVEAIARGEKPSPNELSEAGSVAFDVARYLVSKPGPLPKELWDRAIEAFGNEGTVALVHYVGAYAYTCVILNAMDAPVPEDQTHKLLESRAAA